MRRHFGLPTALTAAALVGFGLIASGSNVRADEVKSGLKPGEAPPAFLVQDATGPAAGTGKLCYRCRYGGNPVVAVFTHKIDANLTSLVKEVDAQVEKNKDKKLKAFVVLLTNDPDKAEPQLKELAEKNNIKNVPLTIFDGPLGPLDYKLSPKAETTVLMWVKSDVKVNHAFSEGKLDQKSIDAIVHDTGKILD
ncbi:MAG TPA: hypothetical protein VMR25_26360 [Planctomycetaceae bacterium]|nr:hypothetical protein [Planctomycetaceae bacterium]